MHFFQGGWHWRALDISAEQRGWPALLPLRAHRVGRWRWAHQSQVWQVVAVQHGAVGSLAATGNPQVWDQLSADSVINNYN